MRTSSTGQANDESLDPSSIDLDSTGRLPKSTILTSLSSGAASNSAAGKYTYDEVRETLKSVNLDASGAVELDDFVDLVAKLKDGTNASASQVVRGGALSSLMGGAARGPAPGADTQSGGGKVLVKGSNANITHSINEDERTEFTRHINQVSNHPPLFQWGGGVAVPAHLGPSANLPS